MSAPTIEEVKALRDQTGVSIMQCKKALEEAGGDLEKALIILKQKSGAAAAKKADRDARDGIIVIESDGKRAVVLTLHSETDFVAKNSDFQTLAKSLVKKAFEVGADTIKETSTTMINEVIQKLGENIQLGEVVEKAGENVGVYNHNGKIAVVTVLSGGSAELAKDISMHISAMKPAYISKEDVPTEALAKVRELFSEELAKENKPEEIKTKILEGKLSTYFKEQTLLEQPFIKDGSKTIGQLLKDAGNVKIESFTLKMI